MARAGRRAHRGRGQRAHPRFARRLPPRRRRGRPAAPSRGRAPSIAALQSSGHATNGAVVLAVCAGYQLIGHRYVAADGAVLEGFGLVDLETRAGAGRLIGEVVVQPAPSSFWLGDPLPLLTGFENHGGRTTLGPGVEPLGPVSDRGRQRRWPGDGRCTRRASRRHLPARTAAASQPGSRRSAPVVDRRRSPADRPGAREAADLDDRLHDERLRAGRRHGFRKWLQDRLLARG